MKYFIILFLPLFILCDEIKNQIYYDIPEQSVSHCVRRLNRSSVIGCSSESAGNVGSLEIFYENIDLGLAELRRDSILLLPASLFEQNITNKLFGNKFIRGIIIIEGNFCNESICNESSANQPFSEDYKIPNIEFSYSHNHTFNSEGSAYGFKNWPFPIAFMSNKHVNEQMKLVSCFNKFNKNPTSKRRCSIEIKNFMAAVKSGETCIKYQHIQNRFAGMFHPVQFCTDFTGMNYYVHAKETVKNREPNSTIVLIARIDSLSMFERSAVSVNGAITSSAVLLSVMKHLTSQPEFKNGTKLNKDVLFLFLDNESYDYLGSSRFYMDLEHNNVASSSSSPINASHLDLLLDFGELAYSNFSEFNFFSSHSYLKDESRNKTLAYLKRLGTYFQQFGFQKSNMEQRLDPPPSSVQFLLKKRLMPAIVMADHQGTFYNSFYNSFLDKAPPMNNTQELLAVANAVASFVYKETTGNDLGSVMTGSSAYAPSKIVECFSQNLLCDLMKEIMPLKTLSQLQSLGMPIPTQAHSSTKLIPSDYRYSYLLRNLIVYLSGEKTNDSFCDSCKSCPNFTWISSENDTQQCFRTRIDAYDEFSFDGVSYPLWLTSSIIDRQSVRMFISGPNRSLLTTGILLTLISLTIMTLLSPKISVIFSNDLN